MSITPENNRDIHEGPSHVWATFGDPSLNRWWVIARTNLVTDGRTDGRTDCRTDGPTDGRTDAGNDNTWRPILASGNNRRRYHYQNEAWLQTIKAPSMPCRCPAGPWKHYLVFMPHDWWNWQIKLLKSVPIKVIGARTRWTGSFLHTCE